MPPSPSPSPPPRPWPSTPPPQPTPTDTILFNAATFLSALYILSLSADAFVSATAHLATRLGISPTLVALLTAGAEWEELVVVVASLLQRNPRLALGNVLGSYVGNVLGAFGLGMCVVRGRMQFDRSARLWTGVCVGVTSVVVVAVVGLGGVGRGRGRGDGWVGRWVGGGLVAGFVVYVGVVCGMIWRGVLEGPVGSDADSDSDSDSDVDAESNSDADGADEAESGTRPSAHGIPNATTANDVTNTNNTQDIQPNESTSLLPTPTPIRRRRPQTHPILRPLTTLLTSILTLSLSSYLLAHTSTTLALALGIADSVFGATVLALATTLPEKFVAVLSSRRGHSGILVANTVGSNVFLLGLCLGIVLLAGGPEGVMTGVTVAELGWVWGSAVGLGVVVMVGGNWVVGVGMVGAYVVFLVLEFTRNGS